MADLAALRELYAWMRGERITYARCGELELRIELPAPQPVPLFEQPLDPEEEERRALETLLHSAGVSAEPFLQRLKRSA